MMRENLLILVRGYLGMVPSDKGCKDWKEMEEKMVNEILDSTDLVLLGLSKRTNTILRGADIDNAWDIIAMGEERLRGFEGIGDSSIEEIKYALKKYNLKL